jgi:hypothetical protein
VFIFYHFVVNLRNLHKFSWLSVQIGCMSAGGCAGLYTALPSHTLHLHKVCIHSQHKVKKIKKINQDLNS